MVKTIIKRVLVNPRKARGTSTRRANPKNKVWEKARNLSSATTKHLVDLYQKSLKEVRKAKRSFEAHFNVASDDATNSGKSQRCVISIDFR
jgi:hypothetical protein